MPIHAKRGSKSDVSSPAPAFPIRNSISRPSIESHLPNARTFTMYARTDNVARKSDDGLKRLREVGVDDLYLAAR